MFDYSQFISGWRADVENRPFLRSVSTDLLDLLPYRYSAPKEIDPRKWLKTEQQGPVGSCSGHAMSTCCEVMNYLDTQGQQVIQLSRLWAYIKAQVVDGLVGQDQGATISGAVQAAMKYGICREELAPYHNRYETEFSQEAEDEAKLHKVLKFQKLANYAECFRWLSSGLGAIEIGIPWQTSLAENSNGIINSASGRSLGGHALAIVGYVERLDPDGKQYLIMANSHGQQWGDGGFALVSSACFNRWGSDSYCEMIGMTDIQEFQASRINWLDLAPFA